MRLHPTRIEALVRHLQNNNTRPGTITKLQKACEGGQLYWHSDGIWTAILLLYPGKSPMLGISKRCTYGKRADKYKGSVGVSVAASRLLQGNAPVHLSFRKLMLAMAGEVVKE